MSIEKADRIVFIISGGVGKNIMATAVVKELRKKFPKKEIVVGTPHTLVWLNNKEINKVINFVQDNGFYKNYINNSDTFVMADDPYLRTDFIYKRKNLIEIWTEMFGIEYSGEKPQLYFTEEENKVVKEKLPVDKPLFFLQTSGGAEIQEYPISWMRDMPLNIAQEVVEKMNKKGYRTIHLRRVDQYPVKGADFLNLSLRESLCAIQFSDKRFFIDSVAQHAAAALNKPSVVCFIGNTPKVFGYKMHTNFLPKAKEKFRHFIDSYLEQYNIAGTLHECPYDTNLIFDVEEILKSLE